MKRIIALLSCISITVFAGTSAYITWTLGDRPVYRTVFDGESVEFGLRGDGVVVWRKISSMTNSPSEKLFNDLYVATNYLHMTNIWWTNYMRFDQK